MSDIDTEFLDELIVQFCDDAQDNLADAVNLAIGLKGGYDEDSLGELYRILHTLKGHCGLFGFFSLKALIHKMEDMFSKHRTNKTGLNAVELECALAGFDVVAAIVAGIRDCGREPDTAAGCGDIINRIEQYCV